MLQVYKALNIRKLLNKKRSSSFTVECQLPWCTGIWSTSLKRKKANRRQIDSRRWWTH